MWPTESRSRCFTRYATPRNGWTCRPQRLIGAMPERSQRLGPLGLAEPTPKMNLTKKRKGERRTGNSRSLIRFSEAGQEHDRRVRSQSQRRHNRSSLTACKISRFFVRRRLPFGRPWPHWLFRDAPPAPAPTRRCWSRFLLPHGAGTSAATCAVTTGPFRRLKPNRWLSPHHSEHVLSRIDSDLVLANADHERHDSTRRTVTSACLVETGRPVARVLQGGLCSVGSSAGSCSTSPAD